MLKKIVLSGLFVFGFLASSESFAETYIYSGSYAYPVYTVPVYRAVPVYVPVVRVPVVVPVYPVYRAVVYPRYIAPAPVIRIRGRW